MDEIKEKNSESEESINKEYDLISKAMYLSFKNQIIIFNYYQTLK